MEYDSAQMGELGNNRAIELQKGLAPAIVDWIRANPVATLTVLGGGMYVAALDTYRSALRPFAVTPTDVGIDYAAVVWPIVRSFAFLIFVFVMLVVVVLRQRTIRP